MIQHNPPSLTPIPSAGLTMDDWDEFEDVMTNGTQQEKDNYKCWMEQHLTGCIFCPPCPGVNPFK